ncbi:HPr family phosphocarrier protein [Streptosporangium sp. NPDC006013]|uniref:HPr family phosphocarrier protein n=1 Tax=Streptosporangium sp. NPDC006013 TaxID=3155596 RepID=UPI0033B04CED
MIETGCPSIDISYFLPITSSLLGIRVGEGKPVPANSMLAVLALGATHGTEVTLDAEGPGADEALASLADLLARDLDAEETPHG